MNTALVSQQFPKRSTLLFIDCVDFLHKNTDSKKNFPSKIEGYFAFTGQPLKMNLKYDEMNRSKTCSDLTVRMPKTSYPKYRMMKMILWGLNESNDM